MPQIDIDGANSKISADTIRGQSGTTVTVQSGHNLVGSGSGLTALPAGNLTGTVADARISALTASKLTGALPAISGASLTGLPIQAEEDYWTFDMSTAAGTTVHSITASFTPKLAWMTYNFNAGVIGMITGWMNVSGNTAGSMNSGLSAAGYYAQGNGMFQCGATSGRQHITMTASASGQYTISNTPNGSPTGTGYFSLILFGN
jgi:hypothetical protein